jgi:hypothetical protein
MILIFSSFQVGERENVWFAPALLLPKEWNIGNYTGGKQHKSLRKMLRE